MGREKASAALRVLVSADCSKQIPFSNGISIQTPVVSRSVSRKYVHHFVRETCAAKLWAEQFPAYHLDLTIANLSPFHQKAEGFRLECPPHWTTPYDVVCHLLFTQTSPQPCNVCPETVHPHAHVVSK